MNDLISSGTPHRILYKSINVVQNVWMHTHMKIYCVLIRVVRQHDIQGLRGGRGTALHTLDPTLERDRGVSATLQPLYL